MLVFWTALAALACAATASVIWPLLRTPRAAVSGDTPGRSPAATADDVVSEGGVVDAQVPIRVIKIEGTRVVVRKVES